MEEGQTEGETLDMPAKDAEDTQLPADVTETLPSYLLRLTSPFESINLEDVTEEARGNGGGGDSDDEADNFLDHDAALVEAIAERQKGTEDEEIIDDSDRNSVVLQQGPGLVIDIKVPRTPDDWVPAEQKEDKGQPDFVDTDIPGDWSEYTFPPKFEKSGGCYKTMFFQLLHKLKSHL